jgi:CYTH domain-containing protein
MDHSASHAPSASPVEIERKFLVASIPPNLEIFKKKPIRQGYLPSFRLREIGDEYKITVKRGSGVVREEFEFDITKEEFDKLWPLADGGKLEKVRYYVPSLPSAKPLYVCELDRYGGNLEGLYTVEVEFSSVEAAEAFLPPSWFGQEVTHEFAFSNKSLSEKGIPDGYAEAVHKILKGNS